MDAPRLLPLEEKKIAPSNGFAIEQQSDVISRAVFLVFLSAFLSSEFGEELVLQRTPQTLTLVGELEDDDDEEFEEDDDIDEDDDEEEEVEVLLSFEHRGREYNLVRLLDPILLVGRVDDSAPGNRLLLSADESDAVMPTLEEMFLEFHDDPDALVP